VKDAEVHADDDRKFHELIQVRNQADNLIHGVSKAIKDAGDKITADERGQLEKLIEALKEALKGTDKADIEAKLKELTEISGKMADRLYAQADTANATDIAADSTQENTKAKEDIVDAVFEEVKDKQDKDSKDKDKE
jgi:molecular chaperone DnaK